MTTQLGRWLILSGVVLILIGLITLAVGSRLPLGRLPGDLRFGSGNVRVFVPLGTSLLLSLGLTLLLNLILRVFR